MKSNGRSTPAFTNNALTHNRNSWWLTALLVLLLGWLCSPCGAQAATRDRKKPTVPTGLTATPAGCGQINLSWTASTDTGGSGLMGYKIYRNGTLFKQVLAPATATSDVGLAALTRYTYTILAIDKAGNKSAQSAGVSATTPDCCTYSIAPFAASIGAEGGTGAIDVTTATSCSWAATSSAAWLSVSSGGTITGNGSVDWSATVNNTTNARTGLISLGGQTFTVIQAGSAPTLIAVPLGEAVDNTTLNWTTGGNANWLGQTAISYGGGDAAQAGLITNSESSWLESTVTGPVDVSFMWKVSSEQNYDFLRVAIDGADQAGISGEVDWQPKTVSVPSGTHTLRWIYVKDSIISAGMDCGWVDQIQATTPVVVVCNYSVTPSSSITAAGGPGSASVTASSNTCAWTAGTTYNWIHLATTSGMGSSTLNYTVDSNPCASPRSGTITVQGQTHTVNQAAATCGYALSQASATMAATGGNGSVNVTANCGCGWLATVDSSGSGWISITSGSAGSGNGTLYYSVFANTSTSQRSGTLTIAGQTFTVTQDGATPTCTYAFSPSSASPGSTAGNGTFSVTAGATCPWTPSSSAPGWLTCSPPTGTGNGAVTWSVTANTSTSPRTGTLTISGQSFSVTQAGSVATGTGGEFQWAKAGLVSLYASPRKVAADHSGNVLAVGSFLNTVDFGNGALASGGFNDEAAQAVAVDGTDNIIVVGHFAGTVDFGGGPFTAIGNQFDPGAADIFVAKFDNANPPRFLWAKQFGGTYSDYGKSVAVDGSGNIYLAAQFNSPSIVFGATTLNNGGMALVKLSAVNGSVLWAKQLGGSEMTSITLAVDKWGDVLGTGSFWNTSVGVNNIFVAKYSSVDGRSLWARAIGSSSPATQAGNGIATDPNTGNVVITGQYGGSTDFGGPITDFGGYANTVGGVFLAAYDPSGNYLWAKTPNVASSGFTDESGTAVSVDGTGNIYFTGKVCSPVYFVGQYLSGSHDCFVASVTSSGTPRWAKRATGGAGMGIALDTSGHILTAGEFSNGTMYFDRALGAAGGSVSTTLGTTAPFLVQFLK